MANPKILYKNLSIMVASGSAGTNPNYPVTNLYNYIETLYWKSNSVSAGQRLIIDLGEEIPVDTIIIGGHNFTSCVADVDIRVQYADDLAFTTGVTDATSDITAPDDTTVYQSINSVTKRYWAIIYNSTVPLTEYPRIGNIFIGTPFEFTTPYQNGFKTENASYRTETFQTLSGITRTTQRYAGKIVYELKFTLQDSTLRTNYKNFIESVAGKNRPFYFIDTDGSTVYYMYLDNDYNPIINSQTQNLYNIETLKMKTQRSIY